MKHHDPSHTRRVDALDDAGGEVEAAVLSTLHSLAALRERSGERRARAMQPPLVAVDAAERSGGHDDLAALRKFGEALPKVVHRAAVQGLLGDLVHGDSVGDVRVHTHAHAQPRKQRFPLHTPGLGVVCQHAEGAGGADALHAVKRHT